MDRRKALKILAGGAAGASLPLPVALAAVEAADGKDIPPATTVNVIIPRDYDPPTDRTFQMRLVRAILGFLEERFRGQRLIFWKKRPHEVDFARRLRWIVYWLSAGVEEHRAIYPVDPIWAMAQLMQESFFYEFTISRALAVGVCQFIRETALEYGLTVAGSGSPGPLKLPELAGRGEEHDRLRAERRAYRRAHGSKASLTLEEVLELLTSGDGSRTPEAREHLEYLRVREEQDRKIQQASRDYRRFLAANLEGRDIFTPADAAFLRRFDQRVLYRSSVPAMVRYMAGNLKARSGNVVAAAAAYNAGLSRTRDEGIYREFGRIPNIGETETYVSRILVNHHEISRRIGD